MAGARGGHGVLQPALAAIVYWLSVAVVEGAQRPFCQMAEALVGSVDQHITEWDKQLATATNTTHNCSIFLEFVYVSRDRILAELQYVRGNFTEDDEVHRSRGEEGLPTTLAVSHMSTAASLVSAHVHIHGVLAGARRECLSEHLQLLFLMSLRRLKTLLHQQLRHMWVVLQGTSELLRQSLGKWIGEVVELFEADMSTMESIMVTWRPPPETAEEATERLARPGPPLPAPSAREPDGTALSTVEVLRRETFKDWGDNKPLLRALIRHILPRDSHVADLCAGAGLTATFLNDTGLMTAYAFDASPNIKLLSKGLVESARLGGAELRLWRGFDVAMCLTAATDFGSDAEVWGRAWRNFAAMSPSTVVLACGTGETRRLAVGEAASSALAMRLDEEQSAKADIEGAGICVFRRAAL